MLMASLPAPIFRHYRFWSLHGDMLNGYIFLLDCAVRRARAAVFVHAISCLSGMPEARRFYPEIFRDILWAEMTRFRSRSRCAYTGDAAGSPSERWRRLEVKVSPYPRRIRSAEHDDRLCCWAIILQARGPLIETAPHFGFGMPALRR